MTHVITQSCCSDASCTYACPVNCIQPTPDDPEFLTAEMLYVDPLTCVDCGACVSACPVSAIKAERALGPAELPYLEINRAYHAARRSSGAPRRTLARPPARLAVSPRHGPMAVAIVGSGPAGLYAADELMTIPGAEVTIFERLAEPYGLARFGVAPDHRRTRRISSQFTQIRRARGLELKLGVEVGVDVTRRELLERFDAVIYAVGAASERRLAIPGIELDGVATATRFVAFYNGHPDHWEQPPFDLSGPRAIVIGNGNVGLDVARILCTDPDRLAGTDISSAALAMLETSAVQEVVVTSRRGPAQAAFTLGELLGLASAPGVELVWDESLDQVDSKLAWVSRLPDAVRTGTRQVRLQFGMTPARVVGSGGAIRGVEFTRASAVEPLGPFEPLHAPGPAQPRRCELVEAGLLLTAIGYGGNPVDDLPFDPITQTVPNAGGRVLDPDSGAPMAGTYVSGWCKRGPTGFLGTNRSDSQETVRALVDDFNHGRLGRISRPSPARS